jgi:hypothetical protein
MSTKIVQTKSHAMIPPFRARISQPYPNIHDSIGDSIGYFHDRYWWHATGHARNVFGTIKTELKDQLNVANKERYGSAAHFDLFMIGRDQATAKPTIMFFCEEQGPHRRAKKTIDEGGLLKRLPGFRV